MSSKRNRDTAYGSGRYPILTLPPGQLGRFARQRRLESIQEAISWPRGADQQSQIRTPLYEYQDPGTDFRWEVALAKPGKEAELGTNENDMFPIVLRDGVPITYGESFGSVWEEMESVHGRPNGNAALEIFGRLFACGAFMACHEEVEPGIWRLSQGPEMQRVFSHLENYVGTTTSLQGSIPMRVFVHLIEAIALQEDTKYFTKKGDLTSGRVQNLQTCASFVACLLGKHTWSWYTGRMSSPPAGLCTVSQADLRDMYPPLQ